MSISRPFPAIGTTYCHSSVFSHNLPSQEKEKGEQSESFSQDIKEIHFLFMWPTLFKSKSIKPCLYSIQIHLQYFACRSLTLISVPTEEWQSEDPKQELKAKAKETEGKFCMFSPTERYCSLSVWVSHVGKRGPKRFPFSSQIYSLRDMRDQRKSATTHEEQRSYHKSCDIVFHGVFMHFYSLEWTESHKDIWDKEHSEIPCVQVLRSSLYHHTCILK